MESQELVVQKHIYLLDHLEQNRSGKCYFLHSNKIFPFYGSFEKNTQHAAAQVYSLVPMQDFSKAWTDEELYAKYGLTEEEIEFIENMIRPMES